jgi:sugar phosphate isomerase/epimerase
VQLYTVRNNLSDLAAILGLIRSIGYVSVETFPAVYNRPARELKALIEGQGLKAPAGHFDYPTLEEKVEYAAELGLETMICPMIPMPLWKSLDGFKQGAEHLNKAAAKARAAGLKFGYHPHNYEFRPLQGGRGFDVLMRELDPSVRLELDIFWAAEGGENPLELMRKNRERLALIHIKDRKPGAVVSNTPDAQSARSITEAGAGTLGWKALLGEAKRLGVKQYFVDQDETGLPFDECLRVNWKYLSRLSL